MSENKVLLYLIVLLISFVFRLYISSPLLLDGEYPDNSHNYTNVVEERVYRAYNPNFVRTSEGYRVELENREIRPNTINRIPNPSHYLQPNSRYPFVNPETSTLLGTVHSDAESYNIGLIEPTPSEIRANGYYSGNDPTYGEYPKKDNSIIHLIKKGVKKSSDLAQRLHEKENAKFQARDAEYSRLYPDYYAKGRGVLSKAEYLNSLSKKR